MPIHVISRDFSQNAGVASIIFLQNNRSRTYSSFVNYSANWIFLAKAGAAVVGQGIPLAPMGGAYEIIHNQNPWQGQVSAIATGAASPLCVTEDEAKAYTT